MDILARPTSPSFRTLSPARPFAKPAPSRSATFSFSVPACIGIGLAITVLHFALIFMASTPQERGFKDRYESLVGHDSYWFWRIIDHGYQTIIPPSPRKSMELSNVAFFPGYPLIAGALVNGAGLEPKTGLLTATHLSTWGFWTYLLLILGQLRFTRGAALATVGMIAVHPGAFFTIAAYSESLFLAMLLGFLFWNNRPGWIAGCLAAFHGFYATGTRIAGFPAAGWPVIQKILAYLPLKKPQTIGSLRSPSTASTAFSPSVARLGSEGHFPTFRAWGRPMLISAVAACGTLAFLAFCQIRFGFWNLYMWTQESGWGVYADYLAVFKWRAYTQWWPAWDLPWSLGRFSVTATSVAFIAMITAEVSMVRRRPTRWRERAPFYFIGFVLFYIAVSGVYSVRLESMIRYQFCTHVFLAIALAHGYKNISFSSRAARATISTGIALLAAASLLIQLYYGHIFTHGGWVA